MDYGISDSVGRSTHFFDVKYDVLPRITEPYDSDGSDNCDYNFVTFDDLC